MTIHYLISCSIIITIPIKKSYHRRCTFGSETFGSSATIILSSVLEGVASCPNGEIGIGSETRTFVVTGGIVVEIGSEVISSTITTSSSEINGSKSYYIW